VTALKRANTKAIDFGLPIISIGNLIVGGSGKTPITIAIAKNRTNIAIVLRGYGRDSKGLYLISNKGTILEDINTSGDEATLLSLTLPNAIIIVSENRIEGILKAKELGAKAILLDDGYRHHNIKKFDILLRPHMEPTNIFCMPSGGYRETKMMYAFANIVLQENKDFNRVVSFKKNTDTINILPKKLILLTAISKPERLLEYLPLSVIMISFPDHYWFTKNDINRLFKQYPNHNIITTQKDFVKLQKFNLQNIYIMNLEINIKNEKLNIINDILNI
jgi:tetraacyldisaccharide 4'-kinase